MKSETPPPENPLLNLLINILLPVMVLNKGGKYFEPQVVLIVALMFPFAYGIADYIRRKHKNYVSLIGILNILLTGGLAMLSLRGMWFAFKEASLPLLLGLMVLGSAWTKNPAARMMFCNPQILDMTLINERLSSLGRMLDFDRLLRRTTLWLSLSFFISALLNFVLAVEIFKDIDPELAAGAQNQVLNEQIARMTWMGFAVIALPLMVFSGILVFNFLKRVSSMTETPLNTLLKA
ncbi:MAG: hypothetical protein KF799_15415 [Bdellovibrionales bacterium]|nr:hypothetical protein [Bdellovibrionales bacterium]